MGLFEHFPYTNFQEKNLNAIAEKMGDLDRSVEESAVNAGVAQAAALAAADSSQNAAISMQRSETAADASEASAARAQGFLEDLEAEVAPAVEDWLEEHITQPTTPVVDDTLSISGAAADAAAVGAKFSDFARTLTEPALTWEKKYIDGSGVISSSNYFGLTGIVPCHAGDKIINHTPSKDSNNISFSMYLCTYIGDTFQAKIGIGANRTQVIPDGVNGFRFLFGRLTSSGVQWQESDLNYWDVDYYIQPASYQELLAIQDPVSIAPIPKMFTYSDFDEESGYWRDDGTLYPNFTHTQKLKIIPGGTCYVANTVNQSSQGAWFDQYGNWILPLLESDITEYTYPSPSKGDGSFTYVTMYQFTAPSNAYYLSLNLRTSNQYKSYVASVPVFIHKDTGNICLYDDAVLAEHEDRKLCIIGASTAMISRFFATAISESICGWQEYVAAFYGSMETFGYSGGSVGAGYTAYTSIWAGIVGASVDLSGFDDFIILSSKNGLDTTGVGSWGTYAAGPGEHDSFMGGLRSIVDYIYSQNPQAHIYLTTHIKDSRFYNYSSVRSKCLECDDKIREMGSALGIPVIDLASESGFNYNNYQDYTYDGTHFNQLGSYTLGMVIRKKVLGI